MKTYRIEPGVQAYYIRCQVGNASNTIAAFFRNSPTAIQDAKCARLALEKAETERFTTQATIAEQTN